MTTNVRVEQSVAEALQTADAVYRNEGHAPKPNSESFEALHALMDLERSRESTEMNAYHAENAFRRWEGVNWSDPSKIQQAWATLYHTDPDLMTRIARLLRDNPE